MDAKTAIEALGLKYHLLTDFTSFVAVDQSNNIVDTATKTIVVPVESPVGIETAGQYRGWGTSNGSRRVTGLPYYTCFPVAMEAYGADTVGGPAKTARLADRQRNVSRLGPSEGWGEVRNSTENRMVNARVLSGSSSSASRNLPAPSQSSAEVAQRSDQHGHSGHNSASTAVLMGGAIGHLAGMAHTPTRGLRAGDETVLELGTPAMMDTAKKVHAVPMPNSGLRPDQSMTMIENSPIPPEVVVISQLDLGPDNTGAHTDAGDKKLDFELAKSLESLALAGNKDQQIKLKLLVTGTDAKVLLQLKELKTEVLSVSVDEIIVKPLLGRSATLLKCNR